MKKFASFIVDHKFIILTIVLIIAIASVVCMLFLNINSDILSYLPNNMTMTDGLDFLQENFNMQGDAIIAVNNIDYAGMQDITNQISQLEGITPGGVIWIGTMAEMKGNMMGIDMSSLSSQMLQNEGLLKIFYPKYEETGGFNKDAKTVYLIMLQLNVASSSDEAMSLLNNVDSICSGYEHAIGGSTQMVKEIFDSTIGEIYKYIIVAVLVMFIILLLTTDSIVQPFVFMLTLGVSILINMGTNLVFPSVSIITFACSAVLQLGLSMDYSIFLMHAFAEERKKTLDDNVAMKRAIPKTFSTITASALTTVGGFLALFFMRFKIGADLGGVLAKGVFLSLVTVIVLQPVLMLFTAKLQRKTEHKIWVPKFKGVAKYAVSYKKSIVVVALILLIPVIIMQSKVELSYIKFTEEDPNPTESQQYVNVLENSTIVLVPVSNVDGNKKFVSEVSKIEGVTAVMSVYTMLPSQYTSMIGMLGNQAIIDSLKNNPNSAMITNFINNGYTLCEVMMDCDSESVEAAKNLATVKSIAHECFNDDYYITGMAQAVLDLQEITPRDFNMVTIVSILIIFLILIFALKSAKFSAVIIGVIEFGIFVNLSITYMLGQSLNFMAYIIISSIQLGATVDYAILYAVKYKDNLDIMPAKEAAYKALRDSAVSVLTSVAIMAGCCLSVSIVTTNKIVAEITLMISRGSLISGILTLVLLPALLMLFTGKAKLKKSGKTHKKLLKQVEKVKAKNEIQQLTIPDEHQINVEDVVQDQSKDNIVE